MFPTETFSDSGLMVHVEGTLTGEGIGYPNNRLALTCYEDKRECVSIDVETEGLLVLPIDPPAFFTVRLWTADRIVADFAAPCGYQPEASRKREWQASMSDTWIIDRERQTAEIVDHPCLGSKTYHWTIEDPPIWKNAKEHSEGPKPSH